MLQVWAIPKTAYRPTNCLRLIEACISQCTGRDHHKKIQTLLNVTICLNLNTARCQKCSAFRIFQNSWIVLEICNFLSPKTPVILSHFCHWLIIGLIVTFVHSKWSWKYPNLTQTRLHSIYYQRNPCKTIYQNVQYNVEDKPRTDTLTLLMTLTQLIEVKRPQTLLRNHVTYSNNVIYDNCHSIFSMNSQSSNAIDLTLQQYSWHPNAIYSWPWLSSSRSNAPRHYSEIM